MNISQLVKWADKVLSLLERSQDNLFDDNEVSRKLDWLRPPSSEVQHLIEISYLYIKSLVIMLTQEL